MLAIQVKAPLNITAYKKREEIYREEICVTLEYEGSLGFMFKKSSLRTCMAELGVKFET